MTKIQLSVDKIASGIWFYLDDNSQGRRSIAWLASRTGISRSTLQYKLRERPDRINSDDLVRIANVLGVSEVEILRAGERALASGRVA